MKKGGEERAKISQAVKNYKVTCLVALIRMKRLLQSKTLKNLEIFVLSSGLTSFRICDVLVGGVFVIERLFFYRF